MNNNYAEASMRGSLLRKNTKYQNMLSEIKTNRILQLYNLYNTTGQDGFPFNDKELKDGLNIYFGKEPTYTLHTLNGVINQPIYVGINENEIN